MISITTNSDIVERCPFNGKVDSQILIFICKSLGFGWKRRIVKHNNVEFSGIRIKFNKFKPMIYKY